MHARVTTYQANPDVVDTALRTARERLIPQVQQQPGFRRGFTLLNRSSGELVSIVFWDSLEALEASAAAIAAIRSQGEQLMGSGTATVEVYELVDDLEPADAQATRP